MEEVKQTLIEILMCAYISICILLISFNTIVSITTAQAIDRTTPQIDIYQLRSTDVMRPPHKDIFINIVEKPKTQKELIDAYIEEIALKYKLDPYLIKSIVHQESRYNPSARNGNHFGLMQVSKRWHSKRATKLGVTNFHDPYGNILLGVDYLSELFIKYKDPRLVLMIYNRGYRGTMKLYKEGKISNYAMAVLKRAEQYRKGE